MWLIVGLGNPGARYVGTRHNVGFVVVDALAKAWSLPPFRLQFAGQASRGRIAEQEAVLLKPQTYMNRSGQSLQAAMTYHRIPLKRVMVVHDDLDLPFGVVRLKKGGGNAGHNGLRDVTTRVGADFIRIRLGIGRPAVKGQEAAYVLQRFSPQELLSFTEQATDAAAAITTVLGEGIAAAQQQFHAPQTRGS